jgi:hypothetical protein
VTVPWGTNVTALAPAIAVSEGAVISPASGTPRDFTGPVTYTVTAADGTVLTWTVTVTVTVAPPLDIWDGAIDIAFAGGTGSSVDPYRISTGAQLAFLAQQVNSGTTYTGQHITLTGNLDLAGNEWTAIGYPLSNLFKGTFNGANHTISNLVINKAGVNFQGLFGYIDGAAIKNLGLEDINVTGGSHVGGVAGVVANSSSVENCYSTGNVTGTGTNVGGVAGLVDTGIIQNCYSTGNVTGVGNVVGGIAGLVDTSIIQNCYSTGNVTGAGNLVGGIAGLVPSSSSVTNCAALNPAVMATSDAGRVAGLISSGTATGNAAWSGMTVTGDSVTDNSDKDGAGITALQVQNGTGLPAALKTSPWVYTTGKLPVLSGFTGQNNNLPTHLQ